MEHPVVFLCMNVLGTAWLVLGYHLLKKGITGDARSNKEGILMTHAPDLLAGLMSAVLGACFWLGSFVWF